MRATSLVLFLLLTGCGMKPFFVRQEPYDASAVCSTDCDEPCASYIELPDWTNGSADQCRALLIADGLVGKANKANMTLCESKRASCAMCKAKLKMAGVIR